MVQTTLPNGVLSNILDEQEPVIEAMILYLAHETATLHDGTQIPYAQGSGLILANAASIWDYALTHHPRGAIAWLDELADESGLALRGKASYDSIAGVLEETILEKTGEPDYVHQMREQARKDLETLGARDTDLRHPNIARLAVDAAFERLVGLPGANIATIQEYLPENVETVQPHLAASDVLVLPDEFRAVEHEHVARILKEAYRF